MKMYERLSEARRERGMSFDELAARTGLSVSTLKKILTGATRAPLFDNVRRIALCLGLSLDELACIEEQGLTGEAVALARAYDALDAHGKRVLRALAELEAGRVDAHGCLPAVAGAGVLPEIEAVHDSALYAKYYARREAEELEGQGRPEESVGFDPELPDADR